MTTDKEAKLVYQRLAAVACKCEVYGDFLFTMLRLSLANSIFQSVALDELSSLRSYALSFRNLYGSELHTIGIDSCCKVQVVDILEEILVVNVECTIHRIEVLNPNILLPVLNLVSVRIQAAIRSNDTITVEVVVACRITSVVATIGEDFLACDRTLVAYALVNEVPDVSTLIFRIFANQIPILLEATLRVAHSVSILTLDVRLGAVALAIFLALIIVDIHWAVDVGLAVVATTLILYRTSLVACLYPVVCGFEVNAVATFIT